MASSRQALILFSVVLIWINHSKQSFGQDGPAATPPSAKVAGQVDDATTPFLQLRPEGVHASIGRLEFSRDGKTLFAVGDSKRVDVWRLVDGQFVRDHQATLRPTIGAGSYGILRSMGVSDDDRFIAVGGIGAVGDGAGFRTNGLMLPLAGFGKKFLSQWGAITLFDRQSNTPRVITSHLGSILGIECVDVGAEHPPLLVVLGQDRVPSQCGVVSPSDQMTWSLRIIRSEDGKQLRRWELPPGKIPPELAAGLSTPGDVQSLVVAVTVNGQVNWYAMNRDDPMSVADPYALALDHDSQSGIVTIATSRGLNLHTLSSPQQPRKCDLSAQLTSGDIIFRVKTSHEKGGPKFGAITTRSMTKQSGHQLRLVDIDAARVLSQPVDLGIAQDPVLAFDPTGTFIAATADVGRGVQVFRREDLSTGKTSPIQVLASDFVRVARATVDDADAKQSRLKLETKMPNGPVQQWELRSGTLQPVNEVPWVVHDTALSFDQNPGQGYQAKGNVDGRPLQLPMLSSGLLPIGRMTKLSFLKDRPIAAIAYMQKGGENRPRLELYDGRSGRLLRRLEGHDTAVKSITFSKSAKRLTSVSEDGMVCVWALDDLVDLVDRRGTMEDARFCYDGKSFLVTAIGSEVEGSDSSLPANGLLVGDQVVGLVVREDASSTANLQTYNSVARLYRALSFSPVGKQATFRIQRQQRELDIRVPLVQAADERKPLFSMVMTPPEGNESPAWLAWSPHGPFESSEPSIESHAGWQFNQNGVGGSSQFAPLSEYRDRFFGRGLIDTLLSQGSVPAQWPPRVIPRLYGLVIDSNEQLHLSDGPLLELPHENLKSFQVEVEGVPSSSVSEVNVTFRKQPTFQLSRQRGTQTIWAKSWLPAEPPVKLKPGGRYFVRVSVKSEFFEDGEYTDFWQVTVKSRGLPPALGPVPDQVAKAKPIEKSTDAPLNVNPPSRPVHKPQRIETLPLPEIQIVSHRRHNREVTPKQWDGQISCTLIARVLASAVPRDAHFVVDVDGETGIRRIEFAQQEVRGAWFRGHFDLPLGQHLVTLVMTQGDQVMRAPTISILRIDPPEIEAFSFEASESGQGRVKAIVRASQPPRAEDVLVRVANVRFSDLPVRVAKSPQQSGETPFQQRYRIEMDGIPLKPGRNQLECVVLDRDQASRTPKLAEIIRPPVRLAPRLSVEMMATAAITGTSTLLPYRVESFRDVTMKVVVNGTSLPLRGPTQVAPGVFEGAVFIPLQPGMNRILVSARTKDHLFAVSEHRISVIPPPKTIQIERVVDGNGNAIPFTMVNGEPRFDGQAQTSRVELQGRVLGLSTNERIDGNQPTIVARVNGFRQSIAELQALENGVSTFSLPLTLVSELSRVTLDLPFLPTHESSPLNVAIACQQPADEQHLHLLMVSTEVELEQEKKDALTKRILSLYTDLQGDGAKTDFEPSEYPAVMGYVRSQTIHQLIRRCEHKIRQPNEQGKAHLVMLYFQGKEICDSDGQFGLVTNDVDPFYKGDPDTFLQDSEIVSSRQLAEKFQRLEASHLVYLDVKPHPKSKPVLPSNQRQHPSLAVIRSDSTQVPLMLQQSPVMNQPGERYPLVEKLLRQTHQELLKLAG